MEYRPFGGVSDSPPRRMKVELADKTARYSHGKFVCSFNRPDFNVWKGNNIGKREKIDTSRCYWVNKLWLNSFLPGDNRVPEHAVFSFIHLIFVKWRSVGRGRLERFYRPRVVGGFWLSSVGRFVGRMAVGASLRASSHITCFLRSEQQHQYVSES